MEKNVEYVCTTEGNSPYDVMKIDAGVIDGCNIPCILALPKEQTNDKLMLMFNNEGGRNCEESADNVIKTAGSMLNSFNLHSPILMPILPDEDVFDTEYGMKLGRMKTLPRDILNIPEDNPYYRLDEQIHSVIEAVRSDTDLHQAIQDARGLDESLQFDEQVIGYGHSGSGGALLHYTMIHPEQFEKCIVGGNGDKVPVCTGEYSQHYPYPLGVKGFEEDFGRPFDEDAYKRIQFEYYIGDREDTQPRYNTIRDDNYDAVRSDGNTGTGWMFIDKTDADQYKSDFGTDYFTRFRNVLADKQANGEDVRLHIYPDSCHDLITGADLRELAERGGRFEKNPAVQLDRMMQLREMFPDEVLSYDEHSRGTEDITFC